MPTFADRTKDTTVTTGIGAVTLDNSAPTGFQTMAQAFSSTPRINVGYSIQHQTLNEWEVGKGSFDGSTGFTRDVVRSSSNSGALVNFSAGTKDIFVTISAEHIDNANHGMQYATSRCIAQP